MGGRGEGWRRERLFAGVAESLSALAQRCGLVLVIEDVHWADSATLDFLTFLARAGGGPLTVVATCRGDEPRLDAQVAGWLAQVRGSWAVAEIRLRPLSREEVEDEVAALVGGPPPARLVDEAYGRAEGNPFFTEQLVAAAQEEAAGGVLRAPGGLPARLAELLAARAGHCSGDARVVLHALAVAGRPMTEDLLAGITRSDVDTVRPAAGRQHPGRCVPPAPRAPGRGGRRRAAVRRTGGAAQAHGAGAAGGGRPDAGCRGGGPLGCSGPRRRRTAGPGGGRRGGRAGVRLCRGGGALAAGDRAVPAAARCRPSGRRRPAAAVSARN